MDAQANAVVDLVAGVPCEGRTFRLKIGHKGSYRSYAVRVEEASGEGLLVHVVELSSPPRSVGSGLIPAHSLPICKGTRFYSDLRIYRRGGGDQDFAIALPDDRVVEFELIGVNEP
ncbi:MAG: hypothetical protein BWY43_00537 [candidate division WS2 bacterium ADurb.Bin280]|uniref:Uncharacterized protein n=1 Tax=candidate division WS2 bacterium ADurb.Bin280 TaxID=1852829 RepID=A0A1V5SD66_9BACT|nr:MAG: hypothetical protein BWY43_00537 [candidate division WS2 bacterium ADurb.Bin280]